FEWGARIRAAGGQIPQAVQHYKGELGVRFDQQFRIEDIEVHAEISLRLSQVPIQVAQQITKQNSRQRRTGFQPAAREICKVRFTIFTIYDLRVEAERPRRS